MMKINLFTIAAVVALLLLCSSFRTYAAKLTDVQAQGLFVEFMKRFSKSYDLDDFFKRFNLFRENTQWIIDWNDDKSNTSQCGVNYFADMSPEEWPTFKGLKPPQDWKEPDYAAQDKVSRQDDQVLQEMIRNGELTSSELPSKWDWNDKGIMLPVRDQGSCGSCYTYSALACVEALYKIKFPEENAGHFSTQQSLDCTGAKYGCSYCSGGWMTSVFNYLIDTKGTCLDEDYPYRNRRTTCKDSQCDKVFSFHKYRDISGAAENTILEHLTVNPLAIAVTSANRQFMYYKSGILTNCGSTSAQIDHAVTAIGFNKEGNNPYVRIRNSWGGWGDKGHINISLGGNICKWRSNVSYPVMLAPTADEKN